MASLLNVELFKGTINNVKKEVLTHTSGDTSISTNTFTGKVSGGGNVATYHEHYTDFKIDNQRFRCWGDYAFEDGDKVVLYASPTNKGFHKVETCKNFTRNFVSGKIKAPNGGLWETIKVVLSIILVALLVISIVVSFIESPIIENIVAGVILLIAVVLIFFVFVGGIAEGKETKQLNKEIANYPEF